MEAPTYASTGENLITILKNVTIEKVVNKGFGLGFNEGRPVFVPGTVPGDVVDVTITQQRKTVDFGEVKSLIKPSPERVEPICEVFGECGGCNWLHMPYQLQLHWMQAIVDELFRHHSIQTKLPIHGSSQPLAYRNKCYFPVGMQQGKPVVGLFAVKSHSIVQHQQCRLLPPEFDDVAQAVISYMQAAGVKPYDEVKHAGTVRHIGVRMSQLDGSMQVIVVTRSGKLPFSNQLVRALRDGFPQITGIVQNINAATGNRILGDREKVLFGSAYLDEVIGHCRYRLHYRSFFQVNNAVAEAMYAHVRGLVQDASCLIDAYAGAATIGIFCAEASRTVYCLENNPQACEDALENCGLNSAYGVEVIQGDVEQTMQQVLARKSVDAVIFDPPRKGVDADSLERLIKAHIPQIIYVSCDPATQSRDCKILCDAGYEIETAKAFDMFPQTFHIEHVVSLRWRG